MAYVNVAEWTSQHVGDWLYGLDDSILPYVQFFVNNQINGCRLLLLSAQDLVNLNIHKIGHQEIILEAVELLRNLHYNITSETLQTISLRLACKSRALFNQLKKSAERAQAAQLLAQSSNDSVHNGNNNHGDGQHNHNHHHSNPHHGGGKSHKKDKEKDKSSHNRDHHHNFLHVPNHHHHHNHQHLHRHQQQQQQPQQHHQNSSNIINGNCETYVDLSPVSTQTLSSVSDILAAVKDFISWIDRYPFDGNEKYLEARKSILQSSIELTSTAQRDQFVQGPNEVIKKSCKKLADLCDRLVQELNDSLAIQAASLEVVTVTKNMDEDLGMHIHSSYSGIHVVGGLKFHSPAHLNGNIEEGDEIVQVNYQTVVGWQLKKLVASMRRFPTKLILTVKKRPRHHTAGSFTVVPQFSLPLPEMSIIGNSSLPLSLLSTQFSSMTMNGEQLNVVNQCNVDVAGCYNTLPQPQQQQPLPPMVQDFRTIPPTQIQPQPQPQPQSSSSSSFNKNDGNKSQTQQIKDTSTTSYDTIGVKNQNSQNNNNNNNNSQNDVQTLNHKQTIHENLNQPKPETSPSPKKKSNTASAQRVVVTAAAAATPAANNNGDGNKIQNKKRNSKNDNQGNQRSRNLNHPHHHHHHHHHHHQHRHHQHLHGHRNHHQQNRIAQVRCSSASDSSPLSDLSDSSTMFTTTATNTTTTTTTTTTDTTDNDDSDCSDSPITMIALDCGKKQPTESIESTKKVSPKAQQAQQQAQQSANSSKSRTNGNKKIKKKQKQKQIPQSTTIVNGDGGDCTDEFEGANFDREPEQGEEEEEEEEEEINDNDSAFYSGRRTNTSTTSSSTISKHSDSMKIGCGGGASSLSSSSSCSSSKNTNNSNNANSGTNNTSNPLVKMRITKSKTDPNFGKNGGNDSADSGIRESRDDGEELLSDYNGGQQMAAPAKPRTSAEFEELYLKKKKNHHSLGLASSIQTLGGNNYDCGKSLRPSMARASTLPPNTQPCNVMINDSMMTMVAEPNRNNPNPMVTRKTMVQPVVPSQSQPPTQFTSIQLSTITHLTSLAKNIRFANMAQVNNCSNNNTNPNVQQSNNTVHTNPHSKSKFDPILAQKLEQTINKLSDGDLVMGNHEDHLYTYKGSDRIGGNSADIPSLGYITDRRKLKKWTKLRSVLKDNCLYSYLNEQTAIACFEIPIHLPGYYILVDKQMFLDPDLDPDPEIPAGHDATAAAAAADDEDEPKKLVVFKLVTYHRLFMFAVDSLRKLIRWIIRFGYRFCCNPTEPQLCFTYYLSPAHIGDSSSRFMKGNNVGRKSNGSTISKIVTNVNVNNNDDNNNNVDEQISNKSNNQNDQIQFSESDDYHDLLTMDGATTMTDSQDLHVKFSSNLNDEMQPKSGNHVDDDDDDDDDEMLANNNRKDAHRFIKSPHPRGSVRFAVKPLRNQQGRKDLDFIDSMIDAKTTLANLDLIEGTIKVDIVETTNPTANKQDLEIEMTLDNATETNGSSIEPTTMMARPPELPPRSASSASISLSPVMASGNCDSQQNSNQTVITDNFAMDVTLPRPKPRISKMAITDSVGGVSGGIAPIISPSKASNSIITSAAVQRLAPIPVVPEKSAAISQTIQHFANLQRQNNLRRSFAQQQQQQQQQNSLNNSKMSTTTATSNQPLLHHHYSDYDYITQRPIVSNHPVLSSTKDVDPKLSCKNIEQEEDGEIPVPVISPMMSNIGNPLYCHVPLLKQQQQPIKSTQDDVTKSKPPPSPQQQSNMDREYNRLFGDRKPSEVLMIAKHHHHQQQQSGTGTTDLESCESYQSSSSDETGGRSSMPPSIKPPPPPPPPPPTSQSIPNACPEDDLTDSLFTTNSLSSPKVQAKRKKHLPIPSPTAQAHPVAPPKPQRSDSNSSRKSLDKGQSSTQAPPTLLPRRMQGTKLVPPPLPKTSHPLLARSNSQQQAQQSSCSNSININVTTEGFAVNTSNVPPPVCPKPDLLKFSQAPNDGGMGAGQGASVGPGKYLNRSFSDAAYGRSNPPNGNAIEPGTGVDTVEQQQSNVVGCSTASSASFGSASSLGTASNNNETSPSNRSLPTMGVSMLAKKRLSNVSADSSAIEKALHNHRQQQQMDQTR